MYWSGGVPLLTEEVQVKDSSVHKKKTNLVFRSCKEEIQFNLVRNGTVVVEDLDLW